MPVVYEGNKKSPWVTLTLFEEWFHRTFVTEECKFFVKKKNIKQWVVEPNLAPTTLNEEHCTDDDLASDEETDLVRRK